MNKRNLDWNQAKIENLIKDGRGKGIGINYKPWITVQDFPSLGRVTRIHGWKTGRMHQFMSDNELRYYYLLEWSDIVIDIREQFPLFNLNKAMEIAHKLGINYPVSNMNKTPIILTTDFLITVKVNGKEINVARTIKPSVELDKKRVIEKFEIERRYWQNFDIDWGIVTDKDIPKILAKNIEWVHTCKNLDGIENIAVRELAYYRGILKERLKNSETILEITKGLDREMSLPDGVSLFLFKNLVAEKEIYIDMTKEIVLNDVASKLIGFGKARKEVVF